MYVSLRYAVASYIPGNARRREVASCNSRRVRRVGEVLARTRLLMRWESAAPQRGSSCALRRPQSLRVPLTARKLISSCANRCPPLS